MLFRCGKARLWELLAWLDTTHECQIKLPETWGFPGGRMDLGHCIFRGSFEDLSRIFREIRLPKVASADS